MTQHWHQQTTTWKKHTKFVEIDKSAKFFVLFSIDEFTVSPLWTVSAVTGDCCRLIIVHYESNTYLIIVFGHAQKHSTHTLARHRRSRAWERFVDASRQCRYRPVNRCQCAPATDDFDWHWHCHRRQHWILSLTFHPSSLPRPDRLISTSDRTNEKQKAAHISIPNFIVVVGCRLLLFEKSSENSMVNIAIVPRCAEHRRFETTQHNAICHSAIRNWNGMEWMDVWEVQTYTISTWMQSSFDICANGKGMRPSDGIQERETEERRNWKNRRISTGCKWKIKSIDVRLHWRHFAMSSAIDRHTDICKKWREGKRQKWQMKNVLLQTSPTKSKSHIWLRKRSHVCLPLPVYEELEISLGNANIWTKRKTIFAVVCN